jgi:hypothetical protein
MLSRDDNARDGAALSLEDGDSIISTFCHKDSINFTRIFLTESDNSRLVLDDKLSVKAWRNSLNSGRLISELFRRIAVAILSVSELVTSRSSINRLRSRNVLVCIFDTSLVFRFHHRV